MAGDLRSVRNEMFQAISDAWDSAPAALEMDGPFADLVYTNRDSDGVPNVDTGGKPWARVSIRHDGGKSTCISGRRYKVTGRVSVQVFVSGVRSDANFTAQLVAEYIVDTLRGFDGQAYLMDIGLVDRLPDSGFEHIDAVANFYWYSFRDRPSQTTIPPEEGGGTSPPAEDKEFVQASPALVWIVNHNLGRRPFVETLTEGGSEMIAEVQHVSLNQFRVFFDTPTAGSALYR